MVLVSQGSAENEDLSRNGLIMRTVDGRYRVLWKGVLRGQITQEGISGGLFSSTKTTPQCGSCAGRRGRIQTVGTDCCQRMVVNVGRGWQLAEGPARWNLGRNDLLERHIAGSGWATCSDLRRMSLMDKFRTGGIISFVRLARMSSPSMMT